MHILRPLWLTHGGEKKNFEVYSCHVSPDGERLVTAAGDGHVRVWSTDAIYHAAEGGHDRPKQLASMSHHSGTIHTVRFSSSGKFLASGADDKIVCIYVLDPNAPSHATFGSNEAPSVENWRIFRRLIGHDNDVQDLGWACDSSILVSVGLDSKIVVWSGYTFEKLKTITSHQSHVKGITFDPANKYFATASDDRTIKVYRFTPPVANSTAHDQASNFILERTIQDPFQGSPLTTYFRRCSWSPDGAHISGANAVNGPVTSVAIIERGTWGADIHLIGHEGPVEATAFCPRLWSTVPLDPQSRSEKPPPLVTVIACAGQDKSISVWITSNSRPIVITQELVQKPISDLSWTPDGRRLFATSLDGSILCLVFGDTDLGYSAGMEENEKSLAKFGGGRKNVGLLESPEAFRLEEAAKAFEMQSVEGRMDALMGDEKGEPTTNGLAAVPKQALTNGTSTPNGQLNGSPSSKANDGLGINGTKSTKNAEGSAQAAQDARVERLKQRVTYTKDGKKRVAPLLVSSSNIGNSTLQRPQIRAPASTAQSNNNDAPQTILDLSKPFDGLPKGGLSALLLGNRRKYATIEGEEEGIIEKRVEARRQDGVVPIVQNDLNGLILAQTKMPGSVSQVPEFLRPAVVNPSLTTSYLRLAVPKLRASILRSLDIKNGTLQVPESESTSSKDLPDIRLEVKNSTGPPTSKFEDRDPARLYVTRNGQPIWQDYLQKPVSLVAGGIHFWAAACDDGSVFAWTPAGRRLMNPILLESQPVMLETMSTWLLVITAVGMAYVFNVHTLSAPHPPVSLAPILDSATSNLASHPKQAPAVTSAGLNSEGRIIVTLSNGDGFVYNPKLWAWQRLSEIWWAIGSQYWNTLDTSIGNLSSSTASGDIATNTLSQEIVPYLEKHTTNEMLVRGRAYFLQRLVKGLVGREGYETLETCVSISHLENRLGAALMLGARSEFQRFLYGYARRLGPEGLKMRAEELLRSLLGPLDLKTENTKDADGFGDRTWGTTTNTICGWDRKELLKGVVLILGKHRDFQRLIAPYAQLLGLSEEVTALAQGEGEDEDAMEA